MAYHQYRIELVTNIKCEALEVWKEVDKILEICKDHPHDMVQVKGGDEGDVIQRYIRNKDGLYIGTTPSNIPPGSFHSPLRLKTVINK